MITGLRNSIVATLVYYDIFDYPLTLMEVSRFLVNPGRITRLPSGVGPVTLSNISEELNQLIGSGILGEKNGFYFLSGRENLYKVRILRQKISDKKWKKFLRLSSWLGLAPYVRGFFACGSMALDNATENSDFDLFVISRSGRLYTSRFFLWLISSLLGARRKPLEEISPDKFCFNHYLTDGDMFLKYQSLYTAQLYSSLKPVFMPDAIFNNFFGANIWINKYLYNFKPQKNFVRRSINKNTFLIIFPRILEVFLNSFIGDVIENKLKKYQQNRIRNNPLTGQPGGRVLCTDNELEFHPHSFEGIVVARYNKNLERLGIMSHVKEADSGLSGMTTG